MKEIWNEIEDYLNIEVSNFGRVYNNKTGRFIGYKKRYGNITYTVVDINGKKAIKVHRLIALAFIPNPKDKPYVDHIDGNGENNDVTNLRWATCQENSRNAKTHKNNKLGIKGVQLRESGMYRARIRVEGKLINLGQFKTLNEAIDAHSKASKKYFGKFNRT